MNNIIKINNLESNIIFVFARNFNLKISILQLAKEVKTYYANVYKVVKDLEKKELINLETIGKANICTINLKSPLFPIYLSFVEEIKSQDIFFKKFPILRKILEEIKEIAPISCIGIFGSYASETATKKSDIDLFIITEKSKINEFKNFIQKYFPEIVNKIDLNPISFEEFNDSLKSKQFTISKEIVKNKVILTGAELFYQIIRETYKSK